MSIPAAVYSLIMFATGAFMVYYFGRRAQATASEAAS
jgi:predicted Na+-dependent transporter